MLTNIVDFRKHLVVRRFAGVFSVDLIVRASGFILLPIYLRLMSQSEYGLYTYLLSIVAAFSGFLGFGLYVSQSKLYHSYEGPRKPQVVSACFTLQTAIVILAAVLVLIPRADFWLVKVLFKNPFDYATYRPYLLIAILVTVYVTLFTNFLLTKEHIRGVQCYNLCKLILVNSIALCMLSLITGDKTIIRLEFSYCTELVLLSVFALILLRHIKLTFDARLLIRALRIGVPVAISALVGVVINFADRFFLEKFGDFRAMAVYNLAQTLASPLLIVWCSLQNVWLPLFIKEKGLEKNRDRTRQLLRAIIPTFSSLAIGIFLVSWIALELKIIPPQYYAAMKLLPILFVTQIVIAVTGVYTNYLIYFETTHILAVVGFILVPISIASNFLLVSHFGIYGAATATLLVSLLYLAIYVTIVNKEMRRRLPMNKGILMNTGVPTCPY